MTLEIKSSHDFQPEIFSQTPIDETASAVAKKVQQIVMEKLGVSDTKVTWEASFTNDLGADSLDTIELIMEFEKEFDLAIYADEAEKIRTVGDAITLIRAKISEILD